jgi:hypothetical protein
MSTDLYVYTEHPVVDDSVFVHLKKWTQEGNDWVCRTKSWQIWIAASAPIDPENENPALLPVLNNLQTPARYRTEIVVEGRQSNEAIAIAATSAQRIAFELHGVLYDPTSDTVSIPLSAGQFARLPKQ